MTDSPYQNLSADKGTESPMGGERRADEVEERPALQRPPQTDSGKPLTGILSISVLHFASVVRFCYLWFSFYRCRKWTRWWRDPSNPTRRIHFSTRERVDGSQRWWW